MKKILFAAALSLTNCLAIAQIDVGGKVKEKTKQKAENKTEDAIDKGLNKIEEGIGNIFKKKDKKKKDKPSANESTASGKRKTEGFEAYRGSAFVPGKDVLFYEDFATARLAAGKGNWHHYEYDAYDEVERPFIGTVPFAGGKWLKMPRKGFAFPNQFSALPEVCTIEFDLYADPQRMSEHEGGLGTVFVARADREEYDLYFNPQPQCAVILHPHGESAFLNVSAKKEYNSSTSGADATLFDETLRNGWIPGEVNHVAIERNGTAIKAYVNGREVLSLPQGLPKKATYQLVFSTNLYGDGLYLANIRIGGSKSNAASEFGKSGKFVTDAIYFDTASATIRPESWATLNEVAKAIKSQTGAVKITGYTDSEGNDDANLKLSQLRSDAVRSALISEFKIDGSRLTADGKGESGPIAPNTTPEGRARNRRVEFTKI